MTRKVMLFIVLVSLLCGGCPTTTKPTIMAISSQSNVNTVHPTQSITTNIESDQNSFTFEIKNDLVQITQYTGNAESIVIPSSIEGKKVTSIYDNAFCECKSIISIVIPDSVTNIGFGAFQLCESLKTIHIPKNVTSIGEAVFNGCLSLESIKVDESNLQFSSQDGLLYNKDKSLLIYCPPGKKGQVTVPSGVVEVGSSAFNNCIGITNIELPNTVRTISNNAFYMCTGLTDFIVPEGVEYIDVGAFVYCSGLKSVSLPESISDIRLNIFAGCESLVNITVAHTNLFYSSLDGVLFSRDRTTLVCYPAGKKGSYIIPESVTCIWAEAFAGCTSLSSITFPHKLTSIMESAFSGCTGLTSVVLPENVVIGEAAFRGCTGLPSSLTRR